MIEVEVEVEEGVAAADEDDEEDDALDDNARALGSASRCVVVGWLGRAKDEVNVEVELELEVELALELNRASSVAAAGGGALAKRSGARRRGESMGAAPRAARTSILLSKRLLR